MFGVIIYTVNLINRCNVLHFMSVKHDTRWLTFKIERELGKEIDAFISHTPKKYGARKYLSRSDFVKRACVLLLEREQAIKEVAAR